MQTVSGFPYVEVQFKKDGSINDESEVQQALESFSKDKVSDLFVISHGWNNNMEEARQLYSDIFEHVRRELNNNKPPALGQRSFAVLGIFWPSKKFDDSELIPSGAASVGLADSEEEEIRQQLEALKGTFDNPHADERLELAKQLLGKMQSDDNAAVHLIDLIRTLPGKDETHSDDGSERFFTLPGNELADILSRPDIPVAAEQDMGGAASFDSSAGNADQGGTAGFSVFGGITSAIRKVLNFTTYFQMKERAGIVGKNGAYRVLARIKEKNPSLRIHLIGHSFGGRLVTSIAAGPEGSPSILPASMTLLQAAFSHNGFANNFDGNRDGFFRKVITEKKVAGPILITHSARDTAVGLAYPIASKLSGDDAAEFGGPDSRYGGIGRNGAQFTPEADNKTALSPVSFAYSFQAGKLYNLKADTIILGHSDIAKPEVAHALLCAIAVT